MNPNKNRKFREYYKTDKYRGFHMVKERTRYLTRSTMVTFTNDKKTIHASGMFTEEAIARAFNEIDNYHMRLNLKKCDLQLA